MKENLVFRMFFLLILMANVPVLSYARGQSAGLHNGSLQFDGRKRTFLVYLPKGFDPSQRLPLVIALHGGSGTPKNMIRLTQGGFNRLADVERFIVVYPLAVERRWNDGRGVRRFRSQRENIDDVGFFSALIEKMVKDFGTDRKRVYVTGVSNGAHMCYRLACELAGQIAAVAPVIGNMPENIVSGCAPAFPISLLIMNGTQDPLVPWEGGYVHLGRQRLGKDLSTEASVNFWRKQNQCSATQKTQEPDIDPADGTLVYKESNQCRDGAEVIFYGIEGGGHTWPGGWQYFPEKAIGRTSRDIDANEIIWQFFKRHSR